MYADPLTAIEELVEQLDVAVDASELARVFRVRERLLAKSMHPLHEFDAIGLYQATKATSTRLFLEKVAGLSPGEAGAAVSTARKLAKLRLTAEAFADGRLSSGTVRAIVVNVAPRVLDHFVEHEAENIAILQPLTPRDAATVMQRWAERAHALVDRDADKPPREDEYHHSETLGGRYESSGSFGALPGGTIATALRVAEDDNPRDDDKRSPAQRRADALADMARFYLDFRNQSGTGIDPGKLPKRRNHPHLTTVTTTREMHDQAGGMLIDGPAIDHGAVEALGCTAQLLRLLLDENGAVRSYDLMPETVTDALFNAVAARDQGCRWPGCHKKPWHCDVHHVHHRGLGGPNCPDNCCLLCRYHHHRGAHDPSIELHLARDGTLTVTYADGSSETSTPPHRQTQLPLSA
jgi:hypothetical protein